jgi:FMN reductase [NAD(P)H]
LASYAQELAKRFGDQCGPTDTTLPEIAFLRQVLARKTVRSYQDVLPSDSLLDLICAAALSASTKSDFQQASILRVLSAHKRARLGELFPAMPWIGSAPAFFVFLGDARRLERIAGSMTSRQFSPFPTRSFRLRACAWAIRRVPAT